MKSRNSDMEETKFKNHFKKLIHRKSKMKGIAYAVPVFVIHMALLESAGYFFLDLLWKLLAGTYDPAPQEHLVDNQSIGIQPPPNP